MIATLGRMRGLGPSWPLAVLIAFVASMAALLFALSGPAQAATPTLSVGDATVTEGPNANVAFHANLSEPSSEELTFTVSTVEDTATAPEDYLGASGTFTIPAGVQSFTLTLSVVDDTQHEDTEQFFLDLASQDTANPTARGVGIIFDNDPLDDTPPVVTVPPDITVEATGPNGAAVTFDATAKDDVDGSVAVTCTPPSGSTFALGTKEVSCSATDAAGNKSTETFNVTVRDNTAPSITAPPDITVEATGPDGAVVEYRTNQGNSCSASDIADPNPTLSYSGPPSGSTFPIGISLVTCTATDSSGNSSTAIFSVTVRDSTPPSVTCSVTPNKLVLPANNHKLVTVNAAVTVEDSGSGPNGFTLVSVTSNQPDIGLGPDDVPNDIQGWKDSPDDTSGQLRAERYGKDRIYTLTYRGYDLAGNPSKEDCSATVTVPKPTKKG